MIGIQQQTSLISEFRIESEKENVSPEIVGSIANVIYPRCGSYLVKRRGRYGSFTDVQTIPTVNTR